MNLLTVCVSMTYVPWLVWHINKIQTFYFEKNEVFHAIKKLLLRHIILHFLTFNELYNFFPFVEYFRVFPNTSWSKVFGLMSRIRIFLSPKETSEKPTNHSIQAYHRAQTKQQARAVKEEPYVYKNIIGIKSRKKINKHRAKIKSPSEDESRVD